ncbi:MAG: hypothetical protein ACI36Y_09615 [Coriobacteriales bacterium]
MTHTRIEGTAALKGTQPRALKVVEFSARQAAPAATARTLRDHRALLFDDERCYEYSAFDVNSVCKSPLKLALVYTSALLFMLAGLALATII